MTLRTKTNEITLSFDFEKLDEAHDFFFFRTSEKYIQRGARILDLPDLPSKALSITFDYGASFFAMFQKGSIRLNELQNAIHDDNIAVKKVESQDLKPQILGRLLLCSLANSNYEENYFNNLTGKLYWFLPEKQKKFLKALQIDIGLYQSHMILEATSTTFTRTDVFKNQKILKAYAKYTFSYNKKLKRSIDETESPLYVHRVPSESRTHLAFLEFSKAKIKNTRAYLLESTLQAFNQKFQGLASMQFVEQEIRERITNKKDADFFEGVKQGLIGKTLNFINLDKTPEDEEDFSILKKNLLSLAPYCFEKESQEFDKDSPNIVFLHERDYYIKNELEDPYPKLPRNCVVQCVTRENALAVDTEVVYKTILKEIAIKEDIIHQRKFTLDDWISFGFTGKWIFGIEDDDVAYFLEVSPDGSFQTIKPIGLFQAYKSPIYQDMALTLHSEAGKGKTIVADDKGNINVIASTGIVTLPDEEVFTKPSRSKDFVQKHLAGLTGINLYQKDGNIFYNCGAFESGLNSSLPNGSLLYAVTPIQGEVIIKELLETMCVLFVKWNAYTVLPYPVKYLREWVEMEKNSKPVTKK